MAVRACAGRRRHGLLPGPDAAAAVAEPWSDGTAASQPLPGASTTTVPQATKQPAREVHVGQPRVHVALQVDGEEEGQEVEQDHQEGHAHPGLRIADDELAVQLDLDDDPSTSTTTPPASTTTDDAHVVEADDDQGGLEHRYPGSVGGTINQSDNGGFAGQSNGDNTMPPGGKTSTVVGG